MFVGLRLLRLGHNIIGKWHVSRIKPTTSHWSPNVNQRYKRLGIDIGTGRSNKTNLAFAAWLVFGSYGATDDKNNYFVSFIYCLYITNIKLICYKLLLIRSFLKFDFSDQNLRLLRESKSNGILSVLLFSKRTKSIRKLSLSPLILDVRFFAAFILDTISIIDTKDIGTYLLTMCSPEKKRHLLPSSSLI